MRCRADPHIFIFLCVFWLSYVQCLEECAHARRGVGGGEKKEFIVMMSWQFVRRLLFDILWSSWRFFELLCSPIIHTFFSTKSTIFLTWHSWMVVRSSYNVLSLILEHHLFDGRAASSSFFKFDLHHWHVNLSQLVLMLYVRHIWHWYQWKRCFSQRSAQWGHGGGQTTGFEGEGDRWRAQRHSLPTGHGAALPWPQHQIMEHRLSLMLMLAFRDVGQQLHLQLHLQQFKQLSVVGQETVVWSGHCCSISGLMDVALSHRLCCICTYITVLIQIELIHIRTTNKFRVCRRQF